MKFLVKDFKILDEIDDHFLVECLYRPVGCKTYGWISIQFNSEKNFLKDACYTLYFLYKDDIQIQKGLIVAGIKNTRYYSYNISGGYHE